MLRALVPALLLAAGDAIAHPGHGATALHLHDWEAGHWALVLGMVAIAGIAAWRAK